MWTFSICSATNVWYTHSCLCCAYIPQAWMDMMISNGTRENSRRQRVGLSKQFIRTLASYVVLHCWTNGILKEKQHKTQRNEEEFKTGSYAMQTSWTFGCCCTVEMHFIENKKKTSIFFYKSKQKCVEFLLQHGFAGWALNKSLIAWKCWDLWHGSPFTIFFVRYSDFALADWVFKQTDIVCMCIYE